MYHPGEDEKDGQDMIQSHEPVLIEVEEIQLSEEDEKKRVGSLLKDVEQALEDRADIEKSWETAVLQYHSALIQQDNTTEDSQIDVPSTREFVDQALSRFMNPIFQRDRVYITKPREPLYKPFASQLEDWVDWILDISKFRCFVEQTVRSAMVFSKAVVKIPWEDKTKKLKGWVREVRGEDGLEVHWGARDNTELKVGEKVVTVESGAWPQVVPTPDFIHPIPTTSIDDAPWVSHRVYRSKDEIMRLVKRGVYREKTPDGKDIMKALGDPSEQQDHKQHLSVTKKAGDGDGKLYEIHEIYTTHDGDEVILTVDRASKTVLRFVDNFYHDYQRPFLHWCYENVLYDIDGISLCYILEPYHRALSACLNQRLDASSRALETLLFYSEASDAGRYFKGNELRGGAYAVNSVGKLSDQFVKFELGRSFDQMETLEADLRRSMQKLASLTDYNAGIEQIERPTATGQVALIEEGRQPQYNRMTDFRIFLTGVIEMIIARYRQWHPVSIEWYMETRSPEQAEMLKSVLEWPDEYWRNQIIIEPAVSSQTLNRDLRKQEWLSLVQAMPPILEQMMGMISQAVEPSPLAPAAAKMLAFFSRFVVQPWMEEFEIAGREFMNFAEEVDAGAMLAQLMGQVQELAQQAQMGQREVEVLEAANDHLVRAYIARTGEHPPPPQPTGGQGAGGQAPPQEGMGGGAPVPGGQGGGPVA